MKNKIFTAIFLIISILWISESIAQPGRYIRKKVQPDFFIPNKALDKPEALPEFYIPEPEVTTEKKEVTTRQPEETFILPENLSTINVNEIATNENDDDIIIIDDSDLADEIYYVSDYLHYIDDIDLRDLPLYKKKYEEYLEDLITISTTGEMPENKSLTNDLAMMNSNLKTMVDDDFGIKYKEKDNIPVEKAL